MRESTMHRPTTDKMFFVHAEKGHTKILLPCWPTADVASKTSAGRIATLLIGHGWAAVRVLHGPTPQH